MKENQTISREPFLKAINLVRPALASQAFIPALTHVIFKDGEVIAYNDVTAIAVECAFTMDTCLPGDLLIKLLNSIKADELLVSKADKGALLFSGGRSKLKIPTLAAEDFPFEFPEDEELGSFKVGADLLSGIEKCLISVGNDPTHPAQMGVTLESGGAVYSTNNVSLSRYQSKEKSIKLPGDIPVILPTFFCQQLISLSKSFPKSAITLELRNGSITANIGDQCSIFTKMLDDLEPMDFDRIINKHCSDEDIEEFAEVIPDSFDSSIERALLILSTELDKMTEITIEGGKLTMLSVSGTAQADDSMKFKGEGESGKPFSIDPTLVARASKVCNKVAALRDVLVFSNEDASFIHLIAHVAPAFK